MSDLEKALERHASYETQEWEKPILDAARKWASLTSPETIEKAAMLLHNRRPKCYESFGNEEEGCYCASNAEAVLRSVEEGKT